MISLGGFANGYDTGSIGAMLTMLQFNHSIGVLSPFYLGFMVSLVMLAAVIPSILSGYLADSFGPLRIIALGAALLGIGSLLDSTALNLGQFIAGRAVAGLGSGVYLGNISVYICEIAPFLITVGICAGYFTCYRSVAIPSSLAWRLPLIVQCVVALCVRLKFPMGEAETNFLNSEQRPSMSEWRRALLLFTEAYRARTALGLFVLGMIQLSGIDGVLYVINHSTHRPDTASFLASGLSGILMLVVPIPAFLWADKWGRRTSAITGGAIDRSAVAKWVVVIGVFIFGMAYCATWGIALAFFANWLVAILTPILLDQSSSGVYFLFGGVALVTVITLTMYMPDTRGRSLEDIQSAFRQPSFRSAMLDDLA
ncbi:major facilitator superfamily domain-containing protein [Aspergillus cavernicola]|uniref:Major facilitator superfamily domain-containing protein n=1 Tax=Aspergillus cavernicola TaxID=176166 RepID=A0ABR4IDZ2_9EURO